MHAGRAKRLKLPTFSVQGARHSEQHGPDKHPTSGRLHLSRPGASSPYPGGAPDYPQSGAALSGLPDESGYDSAAVAPFSNLSNFSRGIPCRGVTSGEARRSQARSREGLSGEWQVDSARPQEEPCRPRVRHSTLEARGESVREIKKMTKRRPVGFPEAFKALSEL